MNDIEILERLKIQTKNAYECGLASGTEKKQWKEEYQAIENIIARNKELEKQMGKDLDVVYIKGVYDERDKWKEKVKEKIEEYKKDYDRQDKECLYNMTKITAGKISSLQELLQ